MGGGRLAEQTARLARDADGMLYRLGDGHVGVSLCRGGSIARAAGWCARERLNGGEGREASRLQLPPSSAAWPNALRVSFDHTRRGVC